MEIILELDSILADQLEPDKRLSTKSILFIEADLIEYLRTHFRDLQTYSLSTITKE